MCDCNWCQYVAEEAERVARATRDPFMDMLRLRDRNIDAIRLAQINTQNRVRRNMTCNRCGQLSRARTCYACSMSEYDISDGYGEQ